MVFHKDIDIPKLLNVRHEVLVILNRLIRVYEFDEDDLRNQYNLSDLNLEPLLLLLGLQLRIELLRERHDLLLICRLDAR